MLVSHHNMKWNNKLDNGHYSTLPITGNQDNQAQKPERHNKLEPFQPGISTTVLPVNATPTSLANSVPLPSASSSSNGIISTPTPTASSAYLPVQYLYSYPAPVLPSAMPQNSIVGQSGVVNQAGIVSPAWPMPIPEVSTAGSSSQLTKNFSYSNSASPTSSQSIGYSDSSKNDKSDRRKANNSKMSSNSTSDSETSKRSPKQPNQKFPAKRSRMGCITCRQRKKRCCETRPKCTECSRLRLNCVWPVPGTEHKNKSKELKEEENVIHHEIYGKIKVLRGIVEYKSDEDPRFQK